MLPMSPVAVADLARLVLDRGYAPAGAVEAARREYEASRERGEPAEFLQLLLRSRHLTATQVVEVLAASQEFSEPETRAPGASAPLPPPRRLGEYDLLRTIGRGGMGVVYLARHRVLGREVALKVLEPGPFGPSPERWKRFLREGQALARLAHPNIVRIYDWGQEGEVGYLAMNLVAGPSFDEAVRRGDLDRPAILAKVESIARALHAAHEAGIVHRDVKPANIRLDDSGEPILLDFGLVREMGIPGSTTRDGQAVGTPYYMAPEQCRGAHDEVDARTDVFALGVVLYESLTGRRPYEGESALEVYAQIQSREPRPTRSLDPTVPPAVDRICLTAMARRREDRYPTALAMAEDVARFLRGEGVRARAPRPRGRRRFVLPAGLVAVVSVTAGVAVLRPWGRAEPIPSALGAEDYYSRGLERAEAGDVDGAIADYSKAIELDPSHARALAGRGALLVRRSGGSAGAGDLDRAIELDPDQPEYLVDRGIVRELRGDREGAVHDFGRAIALDGACSVALRHRAALRLLEGDLAGARADLDRAIEVAPGDAETRRQRALVAEQQGDLGAAIADLGAAIELVPDRAEWLLARARLRFEAGDRAGALDDLDRALGLEPDSVQAILERATGRMGVGRLEEALADADRAVELAPESPKARLIRGSVHLTRRDLGAARADLDAALEIDPRFADALRVRAMLRRASGDLAGAAEDLGRAADASAGDWQIRLEHGVVLAEAGRKDEAREALQAALALAPSAEKPPIEARLRALDR